jgi:hypothetical protein
MKPVIRSNKDLVRKLDPCLNVDRMTDGQIDGFLCLLMIRKMVYGCIKQGYDMSDTHFFYRNILSSARWEGAYDLTEIQAQNILFKVILIAARISLKIIAKIEGEKD